jgi:hypothetical protein
MLDFAAARRSAKLTDPRAAVEDNDARAPMVRVGWFAELQEAAPAW